MMILVYALAGIGGFIVAGFLLMLILFEISELRANRFKRIVANERDRSATCLMNDSWWFSEHEPTMNLLQNLTKMRVDAAREQWRREMGMK